MTPEDREFVFQHAHAYADHGSWGHLATAYAHWYVRQFCGGTEGLEGLPDHASRVAYSRWFVEDMPHAQELWEMAGRIVDDKVEDRF